jgi:hypothetical protein
MSIFPRLAITGAIFFALCSPALATPSFKTDWQDGSISIFGIQGFQVLGSAASLGEGASVNLEDPDVCRDDYWDDNAYEGSGAYVDKLDNNFGLTGAVVEIQGNASGSWTRIAQTTVTRQMLEESLNDNYTPCEEQYDDASESYVAYGSASAEVEINYAIPAVRQQLRIRVTGGSVAGELVSAGETIFPRFRESWVWSPGPSSREKKKGYSTLDLKTDPRLAGTRVMWISSNSKNEQWKTVKTATLKKKGKNAVVRMERKRSKKDGWSYVCIDYAKKFPQMSTGNACPKGPISRNKMNQLFPSSANGLG